MGLLLYVEKYWGCFSSTRIYWKKDIHPSLYELVLCDVISFVDCIVNHFHYTELKHRLFKTFLEVVGSEYRNKMVKLRKGERGNILICRKWTEKV